ncbi:hypothetical protein RF11_07694 [Thelohanellus kitauei]|uniref:Uncharacterized protein n=1 Tax=Thelohanellus kitauei TaxID=669202 RepID=A0A0C2N048_THEKT|nr:hypothetical protein RF11_07694 [Thelohanellus kitauei]
MIQKTTTKQPGISTYAHYPKKRTITSYPTILSTPYFGITVHEYNTTISSMPSVSLSTSKSHISSSSTQSEKAFILGSDITTLSKQVGNEEIRQSYTTTTLMGYSFTGCIILILVVVAFKSGMKGSKLYRWRKSIINPKLHTYSKHFDSFERIEYM